MAEWFSKNPERYIGKSGYPHFPWWSPLPLVAGILVSWLLAARWLLAHAADGLHASWRDTTCLTGAPGWAHLQGVVALTGLILSIYASAQFARKRGARDRHSRVAVALAALLCLGWLVLVVGLDPRESRGVYAGCGLG